MLTRKFVLEEDFEQGFQGWKPLFVNSFDPGTGYVAAHDALEHAHGDSGTLEEEMMALGRFWWLRLESGYADYWSTLHYPKAISLGSTVLSTINEVYNDAGAGPDGCLLQPRKHRSALLDPGEETVLEGAMEHFVSKFAVENAGPGEESDGTGAVTDASNLLAIKAWIRAGYRDGRRRFPDNYGAAFELFHPIATGAEKLRKRAELGDELVISASLTDHRVVLTHRPMEGRPYRFDA
ncbi:hypothetical protein F6X40_23775 [Paraburkholderia sp. UCT31]|uniref:hypothetical protein n=1 Tax=Paraburkholderia sp. UCT31 TaxID=2615209 RepID=UPI0016564229|nr:hypothetical protein [Paraburkholderia sp. UCT31]MBC8739736.1 hypothetical protein [Paraburkholderia sp. UCT31]